MKLKLGHSYRTRAGEARGPVERNADTVYPFKIGATTYTDQGRVLVSIEQPGDLVSPCSSNKMICDVTLEDYRRGVAVVMGGRKS